MAFLNIRPLATLKEKEYLVKHVVGLVIRPSNATTNMKIINYHTIEDFSSSMRVPDEKE